jgi:diguanylate cyclase (GGDEF)-like protein
MAGWKDEMMSMKVLVIESSSAAASNVCHQLTRLSMTPLTANSGAQGLAAFHSEKPDLVLVNIVLPDIDGFQIAEHIRAKERDGDWTPIIFLSNRNADEELERGISAGADDYLTVPVSEAVFGAKLRAIQRIVQMRNSLVALTRRLDATNRELRRLSSTDWLTGIANRRQFDETFSREWRRSVRTGKPIALVLCDIDFFKQYNDGYGHQAGDECLRAVAHCLEEAVRRPGDRVTRFGGEEFAVVLPETDSTGAAAMAEKMRAAVEALGMAHVGSEVARVVTVTAGVASMTPRSSDRQTDLVQWADAALYDGKRAGRNRVVTYALPASGESGV